MLGLVAFGLEVQVLRDGVLFAGDVGEGYSELKFAPAFFFDAERRVLFDYERRRTLRLSLQSTYRSTSEVGEKAIKDALIDLPCFAFSPKLSCSK